MLGRKPLFPGRDYIHTLNLVCRVVGSPADTDIAAVASDRARTYLRTVPHYPRAALAGFFPAADPLAIDLLDKLLVFK